MQPCRFPLWPALALLLSLSAAGRTLELSRAEYQDRVQAAWTAQILATLMGFQFEHKPAAVIPVGRLPERFQFAPVDDDYYYEIVALRAFEKYGPDLTVEQLGRQWLENSAGSWGSSEQARLLLARGIRAPDTGHPRYNKLWFTIGPQFSADLYGLLAPAMPNLAGRLARRLGHINGYAEGADGAVFVAGMVSAAFAETDPRAVVRKAARLIHPSSPYRQCLDQVITLAEAGRGPAEIAQAVEDRWHLEYPATNNAVANGGLVALSVWFGGGDFLRTVNLAYSAADFTDADCNAANAAAVVGAMRGMKALPPALVGQLHDRIAGDEMGPVKLTPPVSETITGLAKRTAAMGEKLLAARGVRAQHGALPVTAEEPVAQPAERFRLEDLMAYWNPDWKLERAGFGGAGGGLSGIGGITHLDGDVLATWPRDPVRGVLLRRTLPPGGWRTLVFQVSADSGRAWRLEVWLDNERVLSEIEEGGAQRRWREVRVDLTPYAGRSLQVRLYQLVLVPEKLPGNAYWRGLRVE